MSEIGYAELQSILDDVILLDVRTRDEVVQEGQILGSHCIPVNELDSAMDMDDENFQNKYGFEKPSLDSAIVTQCKKGARAQNAAMILRQKGFSDVRCYIGSFSDWQMNGGVIVKPGEPYRGSFI